MGDFNPNAFMQFFTLIIAAILLYSGISGKGRAFDTNYPEKIKPQIHAILRKFYLAIGTVLLIGAVLEFTNALGDAVTKIIFWVYTGIALALVIAYVILIRVKFGKQMR